MLTSGVLSAVQEFVASWLAHDVSKHGHYFSSRVPKMALYGMFISAPMGHVLIGILQKIFAGRTSLKAKILQILVSNLIVCSLPMLCGGECYANVGTLDCPHPKLRIPGLHGRYRRCPHSPPSPRHRARRFHACHESQLDHIPHRAGLCPVLPPRAHLGSILQHCWIHYWHICQHPHQEEASRSFATTVRPATRWATWTLPSSWQ